MWNPISTAPIGRTVETKIHDEKGERNFAHLRFDGRFWWSADGDMYVYYQPTHWRPATEHLKGWCGLRPWGNA